MHLLETVDSSPSSPQQSSRELECAGLNLYRKRKRIAKERNENLRAEFIARGMAQYDPTVLGFVDETSKDERMPGRRYCRRWRRDLHRFCEFVVVLRFIIFVVTIFSMTLSLLVLCLLLIRAVISGIMI
jgi:hypothetical protein